MRQPARLRRRLLTMEQVSRALNELWIKKEGEIYFHKTKLYKFGIEIYMITRAISIAKNEGSVSDTAPLKVTMSVEDAAAVVAKSVIGK